MLSLVLILLAFLCGSLPFSVWLGRLSLHRDVRAYGDGNPGAANVFRAGGRFTGVLALMLDISKGAAPVGIAYFNLGLRGLPIFLIALAPTLGHAFSPFLRFKGGKAIGTSFGIWIGLTLWQIPVPMVVLVLFWVVLVGTVGWAIMLTAASTAILILAWKPDPLLFAVLAGQAVILAWTHRADLRHWPHLRPWLASRLWGIRG